MFRKNLISQYKTYARNLQAAKNKVQDLRCKQTDNSLTIGDSIKDKISTSQQIGQVMLELRNHLKEKLAACSISLNELTNYQLNKQQSSYTIQNSHPEKFEDRLNSSLLSYSLYQKKFEQIKNLANNRKKAYILGASSVVPVGVQLPETIVKEAAPAIEAKEPHIVIESIPEPPSIPDPSTLSDGISLVNALGEPTLASLGLGGWSPVGLIQNCLEYLHVTMEIPWWGAIAIGTVVVRLLMFPLVVIAQRNAARMNNYLPQLQTLQVKLTDARQTGNQLDAARYSQEMMMFMKEKDLNPLKNMIVPLAQMPLFVSFFMGLRQMANLPVDSLRNGGMWWFTDLTVPDQYFALPVITSITLWATIELGTDTARLSSQNMQTMKYVLRVVPFIILPFTVNFPGAILCYWVSSNFISLLQVGFLQIPAIRTYFNIEPLVKHNPENLPIKSKGFVGGVKDSWTNLKLTRELEERQKYDDIQFQRAGKGPMVKTYKYDPTKQMNNPIAISAKKR